MLIFWLMVIVDVVVAKSRMRAFVGVLVKV
jgi:hypothetical protein